MVMAGTEQQMKIKLNDVDRDILHEIEENGRASVTLLAEELDMSRTYIGDRVRRLREHEYLEKVATHIYDITEKGRDRLREDE